MPSVIIVDDDRDMRNLISTSMKSAGFEVIGSGVNGREAVDLYKELNPDIILLDIEMPVMNGMAALRKIMAQDPEAFVTMLTAVDSIEVIDDCLDVGAHDYVAKDNVADIGRIIMEFWEEYSDGES